MNFRKLILFSFLLTTQQFVLSQGASIKASVEKNKILLGEPVQMVIEAAYPEKKGINFSMPDSIEHFEMLEEPAVDSINENGITTLKGKYQITSFDSGHWVIPPFNLSNGMKSESTPIDVIFSDFDPNQDYHDIKDILEVIPPKKKTPWWWYAAGAGVLVIIVWVIYYLKKKKPVAEIKAPVTINAYEEAMKSLERLRSKQPESKQYYSSLTDIFRLYIFRKKGILSLQKTTDDLLVQLKNIDLQKEQYEKLAQSLRLCDFVKFAKYNPSAGDDENSYREILNTIKQIEQSGS
jgi:hypothetical protein